MSGRLVTLATFFDFSEVHFVQGLLESAGVECFLNGEHGARMAGMLAPITGGVRLQVREEDEARARLLLESVDELQDEGEALELDEGAVLCPSCGSTSFHYVGEGRLRCEACAHQWEPD
jgi:hypothetical protein